MMLEQDIWTALSGISGSISLASWLVVLMPQLIENYKTKSYVNILVLDSVLMSYQRRCSCSAVYSSMVCGRYFLVDWVGLPQSCIN